MLSIEEIENIIKSKYNDLVITSTDCFIRFMFDIKDIASHKEIIFYFDSKDKLYYEKEIWNTEARYQDCNFVMENNAIELKHYLDIEITKQDMIDWLNTFSKEFNSFYSIFIKEKYSEVSVYIKEKCLCLSVLVCEEEGDIFTATNSNEYWRLYNIINNLIEE